MSDDEERVSGSLARVSPGGRGNGEGEASLNQRGLVGDVTFSSTLSSVPRETEQAIV